jgi:hypothetical protein
VAFRTGIIKAVKIFGLPSIVFSMVILLSSNYLQMTSSISNLIQWDVNLRGWNYIPLVSNWFVLTIAIFLCAREVSTHLQSVPSQPCSERCCPADCLCGDCSHCDVIKHAKYDHTVRPIAEPQKPRAAGWENQLES